jgi:hypothetical protein
MQSMSGISSSNRAFLRTAPGAVDFYCRGPAVELRTHGGILFPNQPDISYSQGVNYSPYSLTHTNYNFNAYNNTPSPNIQVTAQFSQVTDQEHAYLQGVIHFLRSVTKMFYGINDGGTAGVPPPVLRFSALGLFKDLKVQVSSFSLILSSDTDLKEFRGVALPTVQTIALDLLPIVTPDKQKSEFSLNGFVSGSLYSRGYI